MRQSIHIRQGAAGRSAFVLKALAAIAAAAWLSGCAITDETFPVVMGASMKSDMRPCSDYAASYNYAGGPYYIKNPESGKVVRRHEGIDFCTEPGAEVIAGANGTVVEITLDNPYRGGRVTIRTAIQYMDRGKPATLYLDALHITPLEGLRYGDVVKAGQLIGHTQPPGKSEIGSRSHVHFSAGPTLRTWSVHTDPNQFWQKGPGVMTCFNPKNPPNDMQIVAPVRCPPR